MQREYACKDIFYHAIRMLLFLPSLLKRARVCIKMYEALECGKVSEFSSHTLIFCGLICTPAVARKQHWNGSIVKWCHIGACTLWRGRKFLCYVSDEVQLWIRRGFFMMIRWGVALAWIHGRDLCNFFPFIVNIGLLFYIVINFSLL